MIPTDSIRAFRVALTRLRPFVAPQSSCVATTTRRKMVTASSSRSNGVVRLAVLHQAIEPPVIGGVRKAMKPGGYKDSSADIAYILQQHHQTSPTPRELDLELVTPNPDPNPVDDAEWSFPDTESGLVSAIKDHRATHLWANTILFASHPLQTSVGLEQVADDIYVVGQPPPLVEKYDDKNWVNDMLRQDKQRRFRVPKSWVVRLDDTSRGAKEYLSSLDLIFPVVGKPIRGRGSHGVKLCRTLDELSLHLDTILSESPEVMVEEFLAGQEATVTVMPPSKRMSRHWALPVVERFNHADGVAPYNGVVAVLQNSRVVSLDRQAYKTMRDGLPDVKAKVDERNAYVDVRRQCELVAEVLRCTAPIRVDVRRRKEGDGDADTNQFVLFDVNMKPNMTGPGRPGREDQASLTALAAQGLGWDYPRLLREMFGGRRCRMVGS